MFANKLRQDATASTKAIVYQLCVAVQKCYEMVKGQKVLIESKGDVTVEGCVQVEVKNYHDHLTDNHSNFWNTLHNWMKDDFDVNPYASLILFTTQQFGENATIRKWNYSDAKKRLEILKEIHKLSEARVAKQSQKRPGEKSKTPTSLVHQRFVLDDSRADKLSDVIGKFVIEACAPDLPELHAVIKQRWLKGALEGKRDDFLDALIGYVSQPQFGLGRSWEITYEAFDSKVGELMNLYNRETKVFPSKFFGNMGPPDPQILKEHRNHTFVRKIEDIEYSEVIPDAIGDYLAAVRTIKDEFKNYVVSPRRTQEYTNRLVRFYERRYSKACRNCKDIIRNSQDLYDDVVSEDSRDFEGLGKPPAEFRNGVLHAQMDDDEKKLQWRLEKK